MSGQYPEEKRGSDKVDPAGKTARRPDAASASLFGGRPEKRPAATGLAEMLAILNPGRAIQSSGA